MNKNYRLFYLLLFFVFTTKSFAQNNLAAGDMAIVSYQSDFDASNPIAGDNDLAEIEDRFSLVITKPGGLAGGTVIFFTTRGWNAVSINWHDVDFPPNTFGLGRRAVVKWTVPAGGIAQGTEVFFFNKYHDEAPVGQEYYDWGAYADYNGTTLLGVMANVTPIIPAANSTDGMSLSFSGDHLLVYQTGPVAGPDAGPNGTPIRFITALMTNNNGTTTYANWDPTPGPVNAESSVPPGLTNGQTCFLMSPGPLPAASSATNEPDNGKFSACLLSSAGTCTALQMSAIIYNIANWTYSNAVFPLGTASSFCTYTILSANTITLSSAAGTNVQSVCINTPITNITYSTTGAAGATFSGLPSGVTGNWAANVVTISGTPTTAMGSPLNYTVTLTGGCGTVTSTGTITVKLNNTITLSSAAGTNAQTVCINTPITNITYSTTGATGATFSGLPAGVNGAWAANVVTISGTPTATVGSPFSYTVMLTGGCGSITANGTITVNGINTITLGSGIGTNSQIVVINMPITNITYNTTGATGATFSGLPAGVTGSWAANVVTITGSPTTAVGSPFNYSVMLTGGCGSVTANGTITVVLCNIIRTSAAGTDAQSVCINTPITNITYSTLGATGATFSGLPAGVTGSWAANVVTISGSPTQYGIFNDTVTLTGGGCAGITAIGSITIDPDTWLGGTSTNWFTAANWSCGVPGAATDVKIPPGPVNQPLISAGTAQVHHITIQSGATLTNNATLNINGGGVVANNGTYKGSGAFTGALFNNNSGMVSPGNSPGCTSFGAGYTNGTGTENIEISGTTACTLYDQLQVTGTATISGTLNVILFGGYVPSCGESYTIMTATSVTGTFATLNYPSLPAGLSWSIQYNAGSVVLSIDGTPTATAAPSSQTICSGSAITTIVLNGSPTTGTVYNWTRDNLVTATGIVASGTGNISGSLTNSTTSPVTVTFTITPVSGSCTGTPITASVLVNPTPSAVATPSSQTKCSGVAILTIVLNGSPVAGTVYNWTRDNTVAVTGIAASGSGDISGTLTNTTNAPVTVTFTITPTANGCPGTPITATILINPTPTVIATPASQAVCSGVAITTIALTGNAVAGVIYNWTRDNTVAVTGIAASGSGDISGTLANTTAAPVTVTFTITPTANGCAGTPITATVLVNPTPGAVATPSSQTVCSEVAVTTIVLNGSPVAGTTYNWTRDNTVSVTGIAANGSGNISGTLTNTTSDPVTVTFTITPTANGCPGAPITATVLVNPTPTALATPSSQTVCSGIAIATIALTGNAVAGVVYNWTRDNTMAVTGISASGSGNISGTLTNTTSAPVTVTFTITPTANSCPGTPNTATVLVNPTPTAIATPSSQTKCSGIAITTIVLNGSAVAGTVYNWTRDNTVDVTGIAASGSGDISGTLTNTTAAPVTVTFTITPTANGCPGTMITATVLVNPTPSAVATPLSQTVCSGVAVTTIVLNGSPVAGTVYNWTRDNTVAVTGIAANGSGNISGTLTNTTSDPVTVTFTITPAANGCPGAPITATVLVNPTPTAIATQSSQTVCSGIAITTIALTGNAVAGVVYNWTRDNTLAVTGIASSGSGNISGTLTNTTSAPITVTFTITPTANSCPGTPITATVLVNPTPSSVTTPSSQTVCSGVAITTIVLYGSAVAGTLYNWTRDNTVAVTGIAANGSGDISGTLTNTTAAPETVTFTITPTANGCPGAPITATVLVNPTPGAVTTPSSQTVCSGVAVTTIVLNGSPVAGTVYNWTRDNTVSATGIAANGSGNISGTLTNTTSDPVTVTFTITPTANGCPGAPITATVLVNPTPTAIAIPSSQTVCSGIVITTIALTGNAVAGVVYNWTRDNTVAVTGIASSGSGNISGTLTNTTSAPITVTFTITPTANSCPGTPITTTVLVNPTPSAVTTPSSQTVCSGVVITTIVLNGSPVAGTVYNWTRDNTVAVTGIATNGSGDIGGTLTNTTTAPVTVTFTITPTANDCPGAPITATVLVNPKPDAGPDQPVRCYLINSAVMQATGTGTWSLSPASAGTANILDLNDPNTVINNFSVAGVYHLIWTSLGCTDTVLIMADNACITVRPDINQTTINTPVLGNVSTNDDYPPGSTYIIVSSSPGGLITMNPDGSYEFIPSPGFIGTVIIKYKLSIGPLASCLNCLPFSNSLSDTTTLSIEVRGILSSSGNIVFAQDDNMITHQDQPVIIYVKANDSDPEGHTISSPVILKQGVGGSAVVNPDMTITFTPISSFVGTAVFTYLVCDNGSPVACDSAVVSVEVQAPADPLMNFTYAFDDANSGIKNLLMVGNLKTNDRDPEGDNTKDSIVTLPAHGTVVLNAGGTYTYAPNTDYTGPDQFLYKVCDDGMPQACDTATVYFTIHDIDCMGFTCIDKINASLDKNCSLTLNPQDVIKNFKIPAALPLLKIVITRLDGTVLQGNTFNRADLGYCFNYHVTMSGCGSQGCWGKICVEDKFPPQVGDTIEYKTCFEFAQLPSGPYKVADNCADSAVVTIVSESFTDYGCDSALYQGLVTRHLVAKDAWGNQSDLNKKIYILKLSLDSVVCARDTAVDCSLEVVNGVRITDPRRSGAPQVKIGGKLVSLWPNNPSCKLEVLYKDERQEVCGTSYKILRYWTITDWCSNPIGRDTVCRQIIEVNDTIRPVVYDTILPEYSSSPHDCGQYVDLPLLRYSDCNTISETYLLKYYEEGILRILSGTLPASHIWLPIGANVVEVNVTDACNNIGKGRIFIKITDNTPPTPVCDEYTQVTVDPTSCWSAVAAADLDNGSHDNCCSELHFAAAPMDSITYWSDYWNRTLESEVGKEAFWKDKAFYDKLIENWINCYVFSDTVHFDECGTNRVVLRVYEACGMPRLDAHVWPCSPHAWYCYNNYSSYLGDFNWNWFDAKGNRSCSFRVPLLSITKTRDRSIGYLNAGYFDARFGAKPFSTCAGNISAGNVQYNIICRDRLYNDCMVNVLVDDKQAPTVDHLEDVTVYCDGAPEWADFPKCDDMYPPYPGELRDSKGVIHGYYGGSSQYDVHMGTGDHNDPQACEQNRGWAPIYCKNWLYLDSFDRGGQVNLSDYFEKPVLVDKKRPLDHTLKANEFTFTDNCRLDDASLTVTNNGTINGCGEGWISRTWTIKDKCGNAVSATQKIIVKHRSDFEVIFPADKKVMCDFLNRTDTSELGAGKPKLSDDDCEQLGVTYKDEIFTIVDSACYKIVRTWTIIDWCIYNPNQQKRYPDVIVNDSLRANTTERACVYRNIKDNNDGYMQYVQIIKVIDELKPHITNCSDQTVCIDKDCTTSVNIPLSGTDNCSDQIRFRADITRPDGTHDKRSDITAITGSDFTAGAYKIQVIAKDQCGNEDTCNFTLTIKDCKKPTPYCLNGIATVVMPSTGSVQVWAKDFDKGASDNCTEASKLKFSFTKNTADASKILTCTNIPNGKEQPINVEVWVTDEAGNQDFCSTYILLQDNGDATNPGGVCKDTAALVANVTGKLLTEEQEGVEFANVDVKGMQGMPSIVTSTDGSYSFSSIPMNTDHVSIKALRDDNLMNGVSTLDLVLIQKHILGTEYLKSPYKMIAADVDNSNDISAIDLLELRKLILGLYDKLPNNTSWKFIPKSYTFSDPSNPWSYPTEDVLTDMSEKMVRDFVGVKIGDVNSSAAAHNLMGTEIRSGETGLIFEVQDQVFKAGDIVSVEFRSPNFKGIIGFQGTMNFTIDKLQFDSLNRQSSIGQSSIKFTENNIGRRWEHEGMITMSWNTNTSMDLKDDAVLFKMNFTAQSAGRLSDVLRIGSQHTIAESYQGKGELGNLSIRFVSVDGKEVAGKSELYQNYPNPFDQRTVIGLNLAEGVKGNLKITDVAGRAVKTISKAWSKGYNEIWLNRSELQPTGILFYSFESKDFTATKRMILIQ